MQFLAELHFTTVLEVRNVSGNDVSGNDVSLTMGLLTVLKKLKQKEKEMRILMLYVFAFVYLFYISSLWLVYALIG